MMKRVLALIPLALVLLTLAPAAHADGLAPVYPLAGSTVPIGQPFTFQFTGPADLSDVDGYLTDSSDDYIGYEPIEFTETAPGAYTSQSFTLNRYESYQWSVEGSDFAPVDFAEPYPRFFVGDPPAPPYTGPVFRSSKAQLGNAAPGIKPRTLHVGWNSYISPVSWLPSSWGKPTATGGYEASIIAGNSSTKLRFVRLTKLTLCPGRGRVYLGLEYADDDTGSLSKQTFLCSGYIASQWSALLASIHPGAVPAGNTYRGDTLELSVSDRKQTNARTRAYRVCIKWRSRGHRCYNRRASGGTYDSVRFRVPAGAGSRVTATWTVGRKRVATRSLKLYE
jgi:hypothetical protein